MGSCKLENIELNLAEIIESTTYKEAIVSTIKKMGAINKELKSLNDRNIWKRY